MPRDEDVAGGYHGQNGPSGSNGGNGGGDRNNGKPGGNTGGSGGNRPPGKPGRSDYEQRTIDAYKQAGRTMRQAGIKNIGGDYGTGIGASFTRGDYEENWLERFLGIKNEFRVTGPIGYNKGFTNKARFDASDSPLLGILLSFVNPALGAAYGIGSNLAHGRPASALASALGVGRLAPLGAVARAGIEAADLAGFDVNGRLSDALTSTSKKDHAMLAGANRKSGTLTDHPDRGGRDLPNLLIGKNNVKPTSGAKTAKKNMTVSDRYIQSHMLGKANVRRQRYAGLPLMGLLDSLGYV